MNISVMLRQARKAVAQEDFVDAERLYALVLQDDEMKDMIDIQIRHAFCLEKIEDTSAAIAVYQDVVKVYQEQGEVGAAKALALKITILGKFRDEKAKLTGDIQIEMGTAQHELGVMYEGNDTTNFEDIDLFGLGTLEMAPTSLKEDSIEVDTHVTLDLVPIDDEHDEEKGDQKNERTIKNEYVSTVELIIEHEKAIAEQDTNEQKPQDTESFVVIQDMIKQGIHQNVADKSDIADVDVELTDIGDFNPMLQTCDMPGKNHNPVVQSNIKDKAGKLFGK